MIIARVLCADKYIYHNLATRGPVLVNSYCIATCARRVRIRKAEEAHFTALVDGVIRKRDRPLRPYRDHLLRLYRTAPATVLGRGLR